MIITSVDITLPTDTRYSSFGGRKACGELEYICDDGSSDTIEFPKCALKAIKSIKAKGIQKDSYLEQVHSAVYRCGMLKIGMYVEKRDRAIGEVRNKLLNEGFTPELVDMLIHRGVEISILDDERFVKLYVASKRRCGWGQRKIQYGLIQYGITSDISNAFLSENEGESELERARVAVSRKRLPDKNGKEKLIRFLAGRGFSYEIARQAVNEMFD